MCKFISVFSAFFPYLAFSGEIYASASTIASATELKAPVIAWPPSF